MKNPEAMLARTLTGLDYVLASSFFYQLLTKIKSRQTKDKRSQKSNFNATGNDKPSFACGNQGRYMKNIRFNASCVEKLKGCTSRKSVKLMFYLINSNNAFHWLKKSHVLIGKITFHEVCKYRRFSNLYYHKRVLERKFANLALPKMLDGNFFPQFQTCYWICSINRHRFSD